MISLFFIALLGSMVPGASFVITVRNSLFGSRLCGLTTALGLSLGMAFHASYLLPGLRWFTDHSSTFLLVIGYIGAAYLLYLGVNCLRAKKADVDPDVTATKEGITPWKSFLSGFITDVLNPKIVIFILALLSQYIDHDLTVEQYVSYGVILSSVQLLWFGCVAMFFSSAVLRKKLYAVSHWIERLSGVALISLSTTIMLQNLGIL
ncbi:LysE family translocator [Vibrio sagamiensis]|uniref:LysE family translocator n=1 Tax=Vibrio sagamiensis TaxID=512650 RepID=UPI0003A1237A|nr:LysE family transporter [Vibrio sagamiensis]